MRDRFSDGQDCGNEERYGDKNLAAAASRGNGRGRHGGGGVGLEAGQLVFLNGIRDWQPRPVQLLALLADLAETLPLRPSDHGRGVVKVERSCVSTSAEGHVAEEAGKARQEPKQDRGTNA